MRAQHAEDWTRRAFLGGLTLAGTTALLGLHPRLAAAEPPPETTRIRLVYDPSICLAPQFIAEELLQAEGFTNVQYVKADAGGIKLVARGDADLMIQFAGRLIVQVDATDPIVALAGIHVGCFELFGTEYIRSLRDLKGKKVGVPALGDSQHLFVASMAS